MARNRQGKQPIPRRPKMEKRIEVRVTEKMRQRLEAAVAESGLSQGEIIRAALYRYLWVVKPDQVPPPESEVPPPKERKQQPPANT